MIPMVIPIDLTIAIPVRNEELNLSECLKAIGKNFVKEIVIIDSGSTDKTKEIAESFGATFIPFTWNGKFPKKRNWFLRNYPIRSTWVLFLDADEYLTEEFKIEVQQTLNKINNHVGYWLHYTVYFMGKQLKGGYPLKKLALFKVGAGEYEKIDEHLWSDLDMEVHEHPQLNGSIGSVKSKIDHRDFRGVFHYINKHNEYSSWEAERFLQYLQVSKKKNNWTWKQKIKYQLLRSVLLGPLYFFGSFIYYGGYKDGAIGFAFAILKMSYFTQIYCKQKEKKGNY